MKRFFCIFGIVLLVLILALIYALTLKPNPKINYLKQINEANSAGKDPSLNAALIYQKAFDVFVDMERPAHSANDDDYFEYKYFANYWDSASQAEKDIFLKNLRANAESIRLSKEASRLPHYWVERKSSVTIAETFVPELSFMNKITRILIIDANIKMEKHDYNGALENIAVILNTGKLMRSPELEMTMEELVSVALTARGYTTLSFLLAQGDLRDDHLRKTRNILNNDKFSPFVGKFIIVEEMMLLDLIQNMYASGFFGFGRFCPSAIDKMEMLWSEMLNMSRTPNIHGYSLFVFAGNRRTMEAGVRQFRDYCDQYIKKMPWESKNMSYPIEYNSLSFPKDKKDWVWELFGPGIIKMSDLRYRLYMDFQAAIVITALHQYKLENGKFPEKLELLVEAGLIESVPRDVFGSGSINYRLNGDDFILYGYGKDFEDNGGKWGMSKRKEVTQKDENGKKQRVDKYYGEPKRIGGFGGDDNYWPLEQIEETID